jgi:hypothetical protein
MNMSDPNYDGQGKSYEQEAHDSMRALGIVLIAVTLISILALVGITLAILA